jgi:hypothetical protein
MLVSVRHKIAFAHYHKTAGTSIRDWFREMCPDAEYLIPENPHLPVRESLRTLRRRLIRSPAWALRFTGAAALRSMGLKPHSWPDPQWRVFGVVRDRFEMMVSLYEYWRSYPFPPGPREPFIECARRHTFRDFVAVGVIGQAVLPYERFFDRGGPLWGRTTLIEYKGLSQALPRFCEQAGLPSNVPLPVANRTPDIGRDLQRYASEIGTLMDDLRRHFNWYYDRPASIDGLLTAI